MMGKPTNKHRGIVSRYFHVLRPEINGERFWALKYIFPEIVIPIVVLGSELYLAFPLSNAGIIVSALGVLGGLLFAHAIFVFQLRMSYTTSLQEKIRNRIVDGENTNLTRMIDELFDSVVYCSALALFITIAVGIGSSLGIYQIIPEWAQTVVASIVLSLIAHLSGCIYRVLRTTSSAYAELQKQKIV